MTGASRGNRRALRVLGAALLIPAAQLLAGCYAVRSRWPLYLDPPPVDRACTADSDCEVLRVDLIHRSCCPTQEYQALNKDSAERWRGYCEHQGPSHCNWADGPTGPGAGEARCVMNRDEPLTCVVSGETSAGPTSGEHL